MAVNALRRFTVAEYYRMAETGLLKPGERVELMDGRILQMSPIGPFHGGITTKLNKWFSQRAKERWLVCVQSPLRLDEHSEPEPDLMLVRPSPDFYTSRHPGPEDVFLVVEVADSSLDYDRQEKLSAYARAGIAEVWLVNLLDRCIEAHRQPHYLGYESASVCRAGQSLAPAAFPDAVLSVNELFQLAT